MTRILGALRPPGASVGRNRATDGFWLRPYLYVDFTRDRGKTARDRTPAQVARIGGAITLSGMQRVANAGPGQVYGSGGWHRFNGFGLSTDDWTVVAVVSFVGTTGTTWAASRGTSASNIRYTEMLRVDGLTVSSGTRNGGSTPGGTNWPRVTNAAIPGAGVGTSHVLAARQYTVSSGVRAVDVWSDGLLIGSDTSSDTTGVTLERLTIGALDRSSSPDLSTSQHVVVHAIWVWDSKLTDEEVSRIMADPWQPLRRDRVFPAAAGSVTGTLAATLADISSTFSGQRGRLATIAATLADITSTISGGVSIQGVISSTLDAITGTLAGKRTVQGTISGLVNAIIARQSGLIGQAIDIDAKPYTYWRFIRTADGDLALVESTKRIRQSSWATSESHEVVSERFRTNLLTQRAVIENAAAGAWLAESGSDAATLQTAIHTGLTAAGIKRYDGAALT